LQARTIGPEGIGEIAVLHASCAIFSSILRTNNSNVAFAYVAREISNKNGGTAKAIIRYCYRTDLATAVVAFGALIAFSILGGKATASEAWTLMKTIIYGTTIISQSTYWTSHSLLRITRKFRWIFNLTLCQSIFKVVLLFLLFALEGGTVEVIGVLAAISGLNGFLFYRYSWKALNLAYRETGADHSQAAELKWRPPSEVVHFQINNYLNGLLKAIQKNIDTFVLGVWQPTASVGQYRTAAQITDIAETPIQLILTGITPEIGRCWHQARISELKSMLLKAVAILLAIALTTFIATTVLGRALITASLGEQFIEVYPIIIVLMISSCVTAVTAPLGVMLTASGKSAPQLLATLLSTILQLILIITFVPRDGVVAAAPAKVAGTICAGIVIALAALARLKYASKSV
jgi:O-antigen/teichoic acid export membrane protein